jgi:predicted MFS family arabinose efflux permease
MGGWRMLLLGFGARLVLLGALAVAAMMHGGWIGWMVLAGFALIQFVWPLLAVAANSLSVRLAPTARGEAVGLFNAATSLASSIGSATAGLVFGIWGFAGLAVATFVAVGAAMVLMATWRVSSVARGA